MPDSYDGHRQKQVEEYAKEADAYAEAVKRAQAALDEKERLARSLSDRRDDLGSSMGMNRRREVFVLSDGRVVILTWTPFEGDHRTLVRSGQTVVTIDVPVGLG